MLLRLRDAERHHLLDNPFGPVRRRGYFLSVQIIAFVDNLWTTPNIRLLYLLCNPERGGENMDYRAEIHKLIDTITDENALVYLCAFLRLYADCGPTGDRAQSPSCSR